MQIKILESYSYKIKIKGIYGEKTVKYKTIQNAKAKIANITDIKSDIEVKIQLSVLGKVLIILSNFIGIFIGDFNFNSLSNKKIYLDIKIKNIDNGVLIIDPSPKQSFALLYKNLTPKIITNKNLKN